MDMAALSRRTITERERIVRAVARDLEIPDCAMTPELVTAWLRTVRHPSSRATYLGALQAWSHFLVREAYRDDDPTIRVPRPKVPRRQPRPLTTDSVRRVLNSPLRATTRAKVLLCAASLRVHEVAKVDGRDFHRVPGQMEVIGKGGHLAYVPIGEDLAELVDQWPKTGLWFPSPVDPSRPVRGDSVSTAVSQAFARVGVRATAHQLRHWFATTLLEQDVDVRVVQELMRHQSLATTAIYTGVGQRQRQNAISRLPRLTPPPESSASSSRSLFAASGVPNGPTAGGSAA